MVKSASTRHDRKFWQQAVATAEAGGASHAEVAARLGVRVTTLRAWIYRLRRERRRAHAPPSVRVLPVEVAPTVAVPALDVRVGDVELRVPIGATPDYVAALVRALRATAC